MRISIYNNNIIHLIDIMIAQEEGEYGKIILLNVFQIILRSEVMKIHLKTTSIPYVLRFVVVVE